MKSKLWAEVGALLLSTDTSVQGLTVDINSCAPPPSRFLNGERAASWQNGDRQAY